MNARDCFRGGPSIDIPPFVIPSMSRLSCAVRRLDIRRLDHRYRTVVGRLCCQVVNGEHAAEMRVYKKRVFLLDVNPLSYDGTTRSLDCFVHWISLLFREVSKNDPIIAVIDGDGGVEYRRRILPSYKSDRTSYSAIIEGTASIFDDIIAENLRKCNIPVIKDPAYEADDVIAALAAQVLQRGYRVVIASPDRDFKPLISKDVKMLRPIPRLYRWSFYALKHFKAQYHCAPRSFLSLRCFIGDETDGVPAMRRVIRGIGRKIGLKLLRRYGTLEKVLNIAAVKVVGRPYVQKAVTKYKNFLKRNYEVLSFRTDVNIDFQEDWLLDRDTRNDEAALSALLEWGGLQTGFHHILAWISSLH